MFEKDQDIFWAENMDKEHSDECWAQDLEVSNSVEQANPTPVNYWSDSTKAPKGTNIIPFKN